MPKGPVVFQAYKKISEGDLPDLSAYNAIQREENHILYCPSEGGMPMYVTKGGSTYGICENMLQMTGPDRMCKFYFQL